MPSPEPESIFRMGVEGGGVDFFRQWNADRAWRITFKGSSIGLGIDDDWKTWSSVDTKTPCVYITLDDAIAGFLSDGDGDPLVCNTRSCGASKKGSSFFVAPYSPLHEVKAASQIKQT